MNSCLKILVSLLFLIVTLATACRQHRKEGTAVIMSEHVFDSIPSGSGLELFGDTLLIVGDDAPFIYLVGLKDYQFRKIPLSVDSPNSYRIDRLLKPDYESAATLRFHGGDYLLVFGSGSKSPERDSLLIVDLQKRRVDTVVSLRPFYDQLLKLTNGKGEEWNLEGATVLQDQLILLNRGTNTVYRVPAERFIEYALTKGSLPPVIQFRASLPSIDSFEARLSGAAVAGKDVLFSASVEKTTDWTKDGPIAGSFVGLMNVAKKEISLYGRLQHKNGKPAIEKLESVVLLRNDADGSLILLALADNDDGKTKLMEIKLASESEGHLPESR